MLSTMTSRSDAYISVLSHLSLLFLFALLVGQVCGIARASKPVVFSYSSSGNSNHPAIISHHYRPLPVDPHTRPPELQIVEQNTTPQTPPRIPVASKFSEPIIDTDRSPEEGHVPEEPPLQPEITYSSDTRDSHHNNNALSSGSRYQDKQPDASGYFSSGKMYRDNPDFGKGVSHEEVRDINNVPISNSMQPLSKEDYRHPTNHDKSAEQTEHADSFRATPVVPASTYHHRGGLTYTPTPTYDELDIEPNPDLDPDYISTTPIPMFESIRNKLPGISEYPPPNRGYITSPFITSSQISSSGNNKILQQPKYFAYSNDLPRADNSGGDEGGEYDVGLPVYSHKKAAEKHVKGGGQEHHSNQEAADGAEGEKGYKSHHEHDSGDKGHHDKESHKGKYKDEKGITGKKKELAAHYDATHQAEKGKKSAKYGESGEHKKGHSTKGEHNIHTKDEYLKKHEFYDEHHEGGDHEKSGGFKSSHGRRRGGKKKKGHKKSGFRHQHKGKKGFRHKGGKLGHHKSHKDASGADDHYKHHKKYWSKGGSMQGKKWDFSSPGRPEK